ncbi:hypothetical protein SCHPADRAFT_743332 [Schizopora paradoxa]|uniref:Uncharacterized protein n=1 Tax=Schizopora paradoxa TaxID=27342 RepID=A0A0H2QZL9_9AGAM|nr:hypothetical protein SCHPADRAFT_743332 [Schizopora paradoxa]
MRLDPFSRCSRTSRQLHKVFPSLRHHLELHSGSTGENARTKASFASLSGHIMGLSNELKKFLEKMSIWNSSEMDAIQTSLISLAAFINRCANDVFVEGKEISPTYANELTKEMSRRLTMLSEVFDDLIQNALPGFEEEFRDAEKRAMAESFNLLTVATFFSSITASTLAISVQQKSTLYDIVNFFWFASLVLSITSAMNSLLAFMWKQSIFRKRSREERIKLPPLIAAWSRDSPLYFLVAAALTFIIGLCVLAYATSQPKWSSNITTFLTGLSIVGIVCATAWFIAEYYAHRIITKGVHDPGTQMHAHTRPQPAEEDYSSVFVVVFKGFSRQFRWRDRNDESQIESRKSNDKKVQTVRKRSNRKETEQMIPMRSATLPVETPILWTVIKRLSSISPEMMKSHCTTPTQSSSNNESTSCAGGVPRMTVSSCGKLLGIIYNSNRVLVYDMWERTHEEIPVDPEEICDCLEWILLNEENLIIRTTKGLRKWVNSITIDSDFQIRDLALFQHQGSN